MKILQFVPDISGGGAERFVVDLSNELVGEHSVTLVTLYDEQETDLFRDQISSKINLISLGKSLGFDWKVIKRLHKIIKEIRPDIIHTHLRVFNYLMPLIPLLRNIAIVHTVHSDAFEECSNEKLRLARKQFFKKENILAVTISNESSASFQKAYGNIKQKIIYNGRKLPEKSDCFPEVIEELNQYKRTGSTKVFVHIGRIETEKNQLMLVNAFNRLVYESEVDAILLIIGGKRNSSSSDHIYRELKQMEKGHDHIHLLNERSNATDYLYGADFFCLASLYEGMPMTLIEAFATGTIPICTSVGGMSEMVSELRKFLLAEKVEELEYYVALKKAYFLSEDKQKSLQKETKQLFEKNYAMERCAVSYVRLYEELTS